MKAIIQIDVPDYQIGQEVSIYFKDTMMIKGIVQESSDDLIRRDELLKAIDTWDKFGYSARYGLERLDKDDKGYVPYIHYDDVIKCIKGIPPVNPQEPKTGLGDILIAGQCECENCIHEEMCKWKEERHGQECAYMEPQESEG